MEPLSPLLARLRDSTFHDLDRGRGWETTVKMLTTQHAKSFARVPEDLPYKEFGPFWLTSTFLSGKSAGVRIHINAEGIHIGSTGYAWGDLRETAILTARQENTRYTNWSRGQRVYSYRYLVLVFDEDRYELIDLKEFFAFWGITAELSRYIEFFKKQATAPRVA